MSNEAINQINKQTEQFTKQTEALFSGFRSFAELTVSHFEKLANAQYEAARSFSDVTLKQSRAALEIRDQAGLKAYVESQQQVAKQVGEQFQGDVQKITALNKDFADSAKKLVESNVNVAGKKAA